MRLDILENGTRESLKAGIHAGALCLAAVMWTYNVAAWIQRRQPHLAVNALVYTALVLFEREHVRHHLAKPVSTAAASAALLVAATAASHVEDAQDEPKAA
jgi:hypothetical protein